MSDSVSVPADLPAAEALRLADRARAAARLPVPTPRWYGPAFGAGFAVLGAGCGWAVDTQRIWLIGVLCGLWSACSATAAQRAMRGSGIMQRGIDTHIGGPVLLSVLAVTVAGLAAVALAGAAGAGPQGIGVAGGTAAGAVFWAAMDLLNRRARQLREAR
ncbi:hypothetical protein PUR71_34065 [Streptomyces sp. SP17BM10]|uniref:hypothetical protein n=1 Tax=Streptomyces sp. SP17BM10 TaxID=3002530 RepID=UPI002E7A3D8E|nr:hypothetical protein [Streptomyces sp. SP17BM10]MEE1787895.1 hypothetical protein [Streptomyces sp. SP17BM10]